MRQTGLMLESRTVGQGPALVMLHGLLGQGKNLATAAAGLAARGRTVTTYDLPNHGRSSWTERLSFQDMAEVVAGPLSGPVDLLGHSMGGKVAMVLALTRPELVRSLVVVDIAPTSTLGAVTAGESEHERHLRVMRALDLSAVASRADADAALAKEIHSARVRGFLLQNLARAGDGWAWRANLDVLARDLEALAGFPEVGSPYEGPTLFLAGGDSDYVTDDSREDRGRLFPSARLVRLKGVGHWVHSEAPELFVEAVDRFLTAAHE